LPTTASSLSKLRPLPKIAASSIFFYFEAASFPPWSLFRVEPLLRDYSLFEA
jgi:hypothetical protein